MVIILHKPPSIISSAQLCPNSKTHIKITSTPPLKPAQIQKNFQREMKSQRGQKRNNTGIRGTRKQMKGTLTRPLKSMLTKVSLFPPPNQNQNQNQNQSQNDPSGIHGGFDSSNTHLSQSSKIDAADGTDEKDFILSQDFFCTPDYITPECQNLFNNLDGNKESISCPDSPEKLKTTKSKRLKQDSIFVKSPDSVSDYQQIVELSKDTSYVDELKTEATAGPMSGKGPSYVSQTAVALRCRVMPPPCIKNPYMKEASEMGLDPFGSWRSKCSGYFSVSAGVDSVSRYRTDFQEIEQIGNGNFSRVFKVLKRIDGCMYAVKHSTKQLHHDTERRKALMEVQALAALGFHENIVAYHTSWFENEKLYIQMELCDYSLANHKSSCLLTEEEILEVLYQVAKALQFIHERGIAHLDVKPDNIYVKNGVYKLGDFGCATLLDKSLPVEEGDARYMPQEIFNEKYDNLDKVDIFSLGASVYELLRGSSLQESGHQLLREGKLPLLPSSSLQLQNLLKVMVDPEPTRRPSPKELAANPIFARILQAGKCKSK